MGAVRILDIEVAGTINFTGSSLTATTGGIPNQAAHALLADRARCHAGMFLRKEFTTTGIVSLQAAQIGGQLDCSRARLDGTPFALIADRASIGQDLLLNNGFSAKGTVHLNGTKVAQQLTLRSATLSTATVGPALVLDNAEANQLLLDWASAPTGVVDLTAAKVDTLLDDPASWPAPGDLIIADLTYRTLAKCGSVKSRLEWLSRNKFGYNSRAYDVLADSYRTCGADEEARAVLIGKQRARRERPGLRNAPARGWSIFLRWTVGYGYALPRIIPWFLSLVLLGTLIFGGPAKPLLKATNDAAKAESFNPFLYVIDLLLPVATLGIRNGWTPTGAAQWLAVAWTLTGWLLGLIFVAAISGALKRD